jgi:hypothetical protein
MTVSIANLTSLALRANALLDDSAVCAIEDLHGAIARGRLVAFLNTHDQREYLDDGLLPHDVEIAALMADLVREADDADLLVAKNGFALLVAYCLELIQRRARITRSGCERAS